MCYKKNSKAGKIIQDLIPTKSTSHSKNEPRPKVLHSRRDNSPCVHARQIYYVCYAYISYMTEVSVSARIPEDVLKDLETFMKEESLEKSASIRKLLSEGLQQWKEQQALKYLEEGKVSFLKAAEMSEISVWELADIVREKGIVWIKSEKYITEDIEKAFK
jgi:predicted HTH domain antitoxin